MDENQELVNACKKAYADKDMNKINERNDILKTKQIRELKARCIRQSDEIVLLKTKLFKEGYYDHNGSKQGN